MAQGIQVPVTATGLQSSINNAVKGIGTLNIPASIDPSSFKNLAQPLGKVSGLATEFEKSIAASNARVIAFGASVGIINGVQNAFSSLVKTTIEVEKSLTAIGVVSGKSAQELEKFGNALFGIAKNTGQSFTVAAEAAVEFSRQGLTLQETLKRTNDALTLTRFTSLSASEAVDTLTAAVNSFSTAGLTTTEILNKLVAVDSKYAVSSEDLAKGLSRAGSIAQDVGVSFDELSAFVTIAQEKTARGGAVIGNALKTIFTRIRSEETIKALEQIGVYSNTAEGAIKPVNVVLAEMSEKLKTLSGTKRIEALEAVASKYNINILTALLGELNTATGKFEEVKGVSAGATNEAYARQLELNKTLEAVLGQTALSAQQLANALGKIGVTDNLKSLVGFFNDLLTSITDIVDSEGIGGQIAKGIVSGLSGVLFKIGVPLLLAIFVKLTRDIAQFGAESLRTILGINAQVKERQALEQAVVNTLIRDQDVMASILALSGNRAKQEEYLLNVYNRQLDALQQVKNIASTVTPALMAGGLSATSGSIQKRGAGGYLPAQEAADVARGVGGASPNSKVVTIPNFAFGGGKTGTMVANTSEYIVPNFANGGSAIFNQHMAQSYGLPPGARKISAAGGYLPTDFAALVGEKSAGGALKNLTRWVQKDDTGKLEVSTERINPEAKRVDFDVYGVPEKSESRIVKAKERLSEIGKDLAVNIAQGMTSPENLPSDLVQAKLAATFNPGSLQSFANTVFEASVGALLGDKKFSDYAEQSTTSAFDLDISGNSNIKESFGIGNMVKYLEVKGNSNNKLMDSVAKKIYQVTSGDREAVSARRPMIANPRRKDDQSVARAYLDENGKIKVETSLNKFDVSDLTEAQARSRGYEFRKNAPKGSAALGYIPNFAEGGPLEDAVKREMAAGLDPSQIRVTTDGRLRNAGNPKGLAVINTRDEPDGKVPNFAGGVAPSDIRRAENRAVARGDASFISDKPNESSQGNNQKTADQTKAFDVGKFLVFQTAVVGTTSAMQSLTEEGSTAAAALETASGTVNTLGTAAFVMSSAMGPWGKAITVGAAAVANLIPILNRWGFTLKDESDKAAEAFISFGKKMKETGENITPEKFLEYLAGKKKTERTERTVNLNAAAIENMAYEKKIAIDSKSAETLSDLLANLGLSAKDVSKAFEESTVAIGPLDQAIENFKDAFKAENIIPYLSTFGYSAPANRRSKFNIETFSQTVLSDPRLASLSKERQEQKKNNPTLSGDEQRALNNQIAASNLRDNILRSIFKTELNISAEYDKAILVLDKENISLERNKSLMTEIVAINEQRRIDLAKITEEEKKFNKELELETRKKVGAGQEKTPTSLSQQTIQGLDINQLIDAYVEEGRAGLESIFNEQVKNIKGAPKAFKSLGTTSQQVFEESIRSAAESRQKKTQEFGTQRASIDVKTPEDALSKLTRESTSLSEKLSGGSLYQEEINKANQKLINDTLTKVLQYKVDADQTKLAFDSQTQLIDAENSYLDSLYNMVDIMDEVMQENDKLAVAARKARRSSDVAELRQKQLFDEDGEQLKDKIRIGKAFNAQIDQNDLNLKAQRELELETINLTKSSRELTARQNNLAQEAINNKEKTRQSSASDILNKISTGNYGRVGFAQETAISDVLKRRGGETAGTMTQQQIDEITKGMTIGDRFKIQGGTLLDDAKTFNEIVGDQTPKLFADGMAQAMQDTLNRADNLGQALSGIAQNFLKTLQSAFLQNASNRIVGTVMSKFATGGPVSGGSGYKDDVPAMLTGGEFVMRKSAVEKFGVNNLRKMNDGGIFLPGVRGGASISGDDLKKFASQTTTSGITDVLKGGGSSAFIDLEDQSKKLSRFGLLNPDTINEEIKSAQAQGLDIIAQREAYRTQQRKAWQSQLVGTIGSAALSYGASKIPTKPTVGINKMPVKSFKAQAGFVAYGGMMRRYAAGGPTDDIPALLMSGEFVMNRQTTGKYGKRFLDSMNSGKTPRFADGGEASPISEITPNNKEKAAVGGDVNITINVASSGSSETQTQGKTTQGGIDYKKMSERVKSIVIETINEEKRLGGSLRSR